MESMPLAVGQALLDFVVATGAVLRSVSDVDRHTTGSTSEVGDAGLGVQTVDTGLVFEYLLGEELAFERDLSERRNLDAGLAMENMCAKPATSRQMILIDDLRRSLDMDDGRWRDHNGYVPEVVK